MFILTPVKTTKENQTPLEYGSFHLKKKINKRYNCKDAMNYSCETSISPNQQGKLNKEFRLDTELCN